MGAWTPARPLASMADARPPLALRLLDRALYGVVRPVVARLPIGLVDALARVVALPAALVVVVRHGRALGPFFRQVGRPDGLGPRLRYGYAKALARFRGDYVYLAPGRPVLKGPGLRSFEAQGEPAVIAGWSQFGTIEAARLAGLRDDRVVRFPYGGEGGPLPCEVDEPWKRWMAHQGAVRQELLAPYQLLPGASPLSYVRALRSGRSLIVLQDVPADGAPTRTLLGAERPLPVGAVRLARAARVPLRFMTTRFVGGLLEIDLSEPLDVDEQGLLDVIGAAVRDRPWDWVTWREFAEPAPEAAPSLEALPARVAGLEGARPRLEAG